MEYKKTYEDCITNLACTIQKYFGLKYKHNTIKELDTILENNEVDNIIVLLCDGLGSNLLKRTLKEDDFLVKNLLKEYNSVYPSTTTAATSSMLSGLNPNEHGWLGWDLYFKEEDKIVTMFLNTLKDTKIEYSKKSLAKKYYNYKNIPNQINETGNYYSAVLFPFGPNAYLNFDDMLDKILLETKKHGKKYIYAYYDNPDHIMHHTGTSSEEAIENIKMINQKLEVFSEKMSNSLLIITADHGHLDSEPIVLSNYPKIFNLLDRDIWLEGRLCAFKVKEDKHSEFEKVFNEMFSNDFILKTKKEVIEEQLFGTGENHPLFEQSLGDYISLATSNKYFVYNQNSKVFISAHAGITDDEMKIPLIKVLKK